MSANLKNPPLGYARQANIVQGPQQINNATLPAHAQDKMAVGGMRGVENKYKQLFGGGQHHSGSNRPK